MDDSPGSRRGRGTPSAKNKYRNVQSRLLDDKKKESAISNRITRSNFNIGEIDQDRSVEQINIISALKSPSSMTDQTTQLVGR